MGENLNVADLVYYFEYVHRHLGPRHGVALQVQSLICEVLLAKPDQLQDLDVLQKNVDGLISVLKRNGEHPGEIMHFLTSVGHIFVKHKKFAKAKEYYDMCLEFNIVFGPSSDKVKDLRKGLQACAKSDPREIRGLV